MTVTEYYFIYGITLPAQTLFEYIGIGNGDEDDSAPESDEDDVERFYNAIHDLVPIEIEVLNPIYKKYKEFAIIEWGHDVYEGNGNPRLTLGIKLSTLKNPSGFTPKPSPAQLENFENLKADLEKAFNTKLEEEPSVVLLANDCHCCS